MNELVALSPAMRELVTACLDVASAPTTILLTGESGCGKERVARAIHRSSPRRALTFTLLSCSSFDEGEAMPAMGHGGSVLLDEVGALPLALQGRLLALLEGPRQSRIMASTNRDLPALVQQGAFRADLYYRLDVFPVRVPALRDRREDLGPLAEQLLAQHARSLGRPAARLSGGALCALGAHAFQGNVRELANLLERATLRARTASIEAADLGLAPSLHEASLFPAHLPIELERLERLAIAEALRRSDGNRTHAARLLGLGLRTLRQKLNSPTVREGPAFAHAAPLLSEAS
jgi:DNA-binding NtrC family response regulator